MDTMNCLLDVLIIGTIAVGVVAGLVALAVALLHVWQDARR